MNAPVLLPESPPRCINPRCGAIRPPRRHQGGYEGAADYCRPCWDRWHRAGKPASGPPDPVTRGPLGAAALAGARAANARRARERADRLADFAELRSWGVSVADAAVRVRVAMPTARQYEAELRDRQGAHSLAA